MSRVATCECVRGTTTFGLRVRHEGNGYASMVQVASASHCVWNQRLGVSATYETSSRGKFLFHGESVVPSGGALALGRPETGEIAVGRDADLALFDPPPWAADAGAVLSALLFDHDAPPMRATWVRGRRVRG